jgi:hypothetical protein
MIELKSANAGEVEMVDLFSIDGVNYQIPAKPRMNIALLFLDDMRKHGEMMANMALLERMLGEKGYKALCEYDGLSNEDFNSVIKAAATIVLGTLEEPDPNSGSGSKK